MSWNLTNLCLNGETINVRFFDAANGMVWPAATDGVYLLPRGGVLNQTLECITGGTVCYGARQPSNGIYWGVDIDGGQSCSSCCFTCAPATFTPGPLFCL